MQCWGRKRAGNWGPTEGGLGWPSLGRGTPQRVLGWRGAAGWGPIQIRPSGLRVALAEGPGKSPALHAVPVA